MRALSAKSLALMVALLGGIPASGWAQGDQINQDNTPYGTTAA